MLKLETHIKGTPKTKEFTAGPIHRLIYIGKSYTERHGMSHKLLSLTLRDLYIYDYSLTNSWIILSLCM